uniref:non-specific serine/threonine protein kinase n=1 Tax=Timema cristinae TaxID=61476 RepID=A0A7R9GV71_TIMCR|nr:unnamed protein product [Timema cristinae]
MPSTSCALVTSRALSVLCSSNLSYPQRPVLQAPQISLERSKGLSTERVVQLSVDLQQLASRLVGEVMIFELAQHTQKFLHEHNKPGFKSFYEEMMMRKQEQLQKEQLVKQQLEDKQRQAILGEVQRKQEVLRVEEKKRRRGQGRGEHCSTDRGQSVSESSDSSCDHRGTELLTFNNRGEREVHRVKCLGHNTRGSVVHMGVDLRSGELVNVVTWTFGGDPVPVLKQVSSLEQELSYLQRLQHPHLVHYLNIKYSHEQDTVVVHILQEFVVGTSLAVYLSHNLPMETDMLRHCAAGIVSALAFLHRNNVVHKHLRASSVFIDSAGTVLVSDYSLDKRLSDLNQVDSTYPSSQGRVGKKLDTYCLGVLLASLTRGLKLGSSQEVQLSSGLPSELLDFINKCLLSDEQQRWSAGQLLDHSFLKTPLERRLSPRYDERQDKKNADEDVDCDKDYEPVLSLPQTVKGQSRIQNEFEVLKWLGKGAFGDVLKVRNKLDGGVYAIKRIKLNPQNKQLNRKITREVKLLSRLNHENVVRYYNSWIDCATLESGAPSSDTTTETASPEPDKYNKLPGAGDSVEMLAPPARDVNVEWNVSYHSRVSAIRPAGDSSDDSSDDDDNDWMGFLACSKSSEGVVFERGDSGDVPEADQESRRNNGGQGSRGNEDEAREIQFMYIQMEFCEKSTLRTAIDGGLCGDEQRVWRLFREVVEGLAHIHQQGMIHRDLKPVNIFLDSNDHVKIGDFGLATTSNLQRPMEQTGLLTERRLAELRSLSHEMGDSSLTGQVGTALYVAPELNIPGFKLLYNQKVDIYSLGIIFFEMCCPLETGMERVKVLANLRHPDIILPPTLSEHDTPKQVHIVRWLLNHDPGMRPSSEELLQSPYLPPPQLEEAELQEMVRHTLSNPQSKAYKYLVGSCFTQEVSPAEDITYHMSLPRASSPLLQERVKQAVTKVFHRHGALPLNTPLLSPPSPHPPSCESCVRLMARSGGLVCLPHDLRVPFARHVAWSGVSCLKRYAVERVYREKKVFGFHPRELYECAFDVVTPTAGNLVADAELLSVVWEIINEFPSLRDKACVIRLNHTSLLRAILLHSGIEEEKHNSMYAFLREVKDERHSKYISQTLPLMSDQAMCTLIQLLDLEGPLSKVAAIFKSIGKRGGEVASLATQAFHELETVIGHADALGVKCRVVVAPGLAYNCHQYSGVMCQFVCQLNTRRGRRGMEVVAAGGRYDAMLASFRHNLELTGVSGKGLSQAATGVSISLDRLVSALQELEEGEEEGDDTPFGALDVVVCSLGRSPMVREKCTLIRELWAAGIRATILDAIQVNSLIVGTWRKAWLKKSGRLFITDDYQNVPPILALGVLPFEKYQASKRGQSSSLEEVQDYCREQLVPHMVLFKDTETTTVRVRSWKRERDRFQEKKVNVSELVEFIQRLVKCTMVGEGSDVAPLFSRSESKGSSETSSNSVIPAVTFSFVTDEKMNVTQRRRAENQIMPHLGPTLQRLSNKVRVEVLVVNVEAAIIKTLASHLELNQDTTVFQKSVGTIIERHPRNKKYLSKVCEEIQDLISQKLPPSILLYSRVDNTHKLLL